MVAPARRSLLVLLAALLWLAPAPAAASPKTLKRSLQNILFSPLDLALSPVVAANTIYNNLRDVDDSVGVRVVFVVPGLAWNTYVQALAAPIRLITGLIELLPGIGLFFFEADLEPLFAPPERGQALFDMETDLLHVRFGVDYTTVPF